MKKFSFIDLFGVPGGMSLGFKLAGFTALGALDIFEPGLSTYKKNFTEVPEKNVIRADASKKNALNHFCQVTGLRRGDIDVVIGGPPCQGFSMVGRIKIASLVKSGQREGSNHDSKFIDDERNNLYKSFVKFVDYFRPKAVVMENVQGMMSYRDGWVVSQINQDFKKIGYGNVDCKILNAADYGVPQKRKRVIFMATLSKYKISWPSKTHFPESGVDRSIIDPSAKKYVSVMDAIGDLPPVKNLKRHSKQKGMPMKYRKLPSCEFQKFVREDSKMVHNHITRWHREEDLVVFSHMKPGMRWSQLSSKDRKLIGYSDASFDDKWKRLPKNDPSWTVVSHLHKDGYMYIHPSQNRTISVREAARLQSFPDNFIFEGSRSAQFKQIGNAVPPLLARAIASEIKSILNSSE